jgi:hypothetical protein
VSECGRHLVGLLHSCRVVVIYDFARAAFSENNKPASRNVDDIAIELQVGSMTSHARYLCYENGRIAVATVSSTQHTLIAS